MRCRLCDEEANLRGSWFCDPCYWLVIVPLWPMPRGYGEEGRTPEGTPGG